MRRLRRLRPGGVRSPEPRGELAQCPHLHSQAGDVMHGLAGVASVPATASRARARGCSSHSVARAGASSRTVSRCDPPTRPRRPRRPVGGSGLLCNDTAGPLEDVRSRLTGTQTYWEPARAERSWVVDQVVSRARPVPCRPEGDERGDARLGVPIFHLGACYQFDATGRAAYVESVP